MKDEYRSEVFHPSAFRLPPSSFRLPLVRFGRRWTGQDGGPKSETFEFLGLTHIAGKSRWTVSSWSKRRFVGASAHSMGAAARRRNRHAPLKW